LAAFTDSEFGMGTNEIWK